MVSRHVLTLAPKNHLRSDQLHPLNRPSLDSIRVKAPGARGLNKPAILTAAGGGVAVVLLLASGAFSSNPSTKPATTKPMMSDPARPEMAQGAIKSLACRLRPGGSA
jgi:hypothetical protein